MPSGGSKADKDILFEIETSEYSAPEYKVIVEVWGVNSQNRKSFRKILSLQ